MSISDLHIHTLIHSHPHPHMCTHTQKAVVIFQYSVDGLWDYRSVKRGFIPCSYKMVLRTVKAVSLGV